MQLNSTTSTKPLLSAEELATAKFTESVDVAVNLGIDARKSDQNVRGATVPIRYWPFVRVAVFTRAQTLKLLAKLQALSW